MNNICQACKQARATVHLTEIDPGKSQIRETHLCADCHREREGGMGVPPIGPSLATVATVAALATGVLSGQIEKAEPKRQTNRRTTCASCGMTYQEFRVKGRFGCAACYDAFEDGLVPLLEKVHGASQHIGTLPKDVAPTERSREAVAQELADLKRRLNRVIKNEDYMEAARIRDRIQELERLLDGSAP